MPSTIGIKNESSLHRTLKNHYAGSKGKTEAAVGEFVADAINENGEYIEIQTRNFASLRKKIKTITAKNKIRIVHPIGVSKIIEVYAENGDFLYRRKSPKKGSIWNLFDALIYAPDIPLIKGAAIEAALVDITEKRINDGKGSWRRKRVSIHDRELSAWHEKISFAKPKDYLRFIPFKKNEEFTGADLAKQAGIKTGTARKALYVLTAIKLVKRIGKKGNAWVYSL